MESFLLTFTPTDEKTLWLKTATKGINGENVFEVLPVFKTIVKPRLFNY